MNKLLVILGSTATGKTDLGLMLAKKFNGEVIACDSRQVYKKLDIGTGKLPNPKSKIPIKKGDGFWEIDGVKIWMMDVVGLDTQFTVSDYSRDAQKVVSSITSRKKLPIIVGGTGLYLKALLYGLPNLAIPIDQKLRGELEVLSKNELQKKLKHLSPTTWDDLNESDKQNPRRLLRAIELHMNPYNIVEEKIGLIDKYNVLKVGLIAPRSEIYQKVDLRIIDWFDQGILDEVRGLLKEGFNKQRFNRLGLEYSLIGQFLVDGNLSQEKLIEDIKGVLHAYVRRQQTWFKKESNVDWFDITGQHVLKKIETFVSKWYYRVDEKKN